MRIIAGSCKGRRIKAPKGSHTRPTSDRVREAVFSTLAAKVAGARVLDLFAGSGALAFEALSRGAAHAVLVDKSKQAYGIIMENAEKLAMNDKIQVYFSDSKKILELLAGKNFYFDLIFLDPPYEGNDYFEILQYIDTSELLTPDGVVIAETNKDNDLTRYSFDRISVVKESIYGDTKIFYFQKTGV